MTAAGFIPPCAPDPYERTDSGAACVVMVWRVNVHWLASYRRPAHRDAGGLEQAVLEAFAAPRPLMAGAAAWVRGLPRAVTEDSRH